jgi:hypothetical protein
MATYSFEACKLSIGGLLISGYGEGGTITFNWDEDVWTVSTGADGETTYSYNANKALTMTVTVKNTSKGYRDLSALQATQEASAKLGIPLVVMPVAFVDPFLGDTIGGNLGVILNRPNIEKGKAAGDVEFRVHISNPIRTNGLLIVG